MKTFVEYLVEDRREMRDNAVKEVRRYLEDMSNKLAQRHDSYEAFRAAALKSMPDLDLKDDGRTVTVSDPTGPIFFDLQWAFDNFNPGQKETSRKSWQEYGKARERQDSMYVGPDGYTGD